MEIKSGIQEPSGFDPGLKCLVAVFVFTIVVKLLLKAALGSHVRLLLLIALAVDFIGLIFLTAIPILVWLRRKRSDDPPRRWALFLAILWASLQLSYYVKVFSEPLVEKNSVNQVKAMYQNYTASLLAGDCETAWSLVDWQTQIAYSNLVQNALSARKADLLRQTYVSKMTVLLLRLEFNKDQLSNMNGRDVFAFGITNDSIMKSKLEDSKELEKVVVRGENAAGYISGTPDVPAFYFIKKDSEWRLQLWKSFPAINNSLAQLKKESRLSEKEFLLLMLREVSTHDVDERIFDGPLD